MAEGVCVCVCVCVSHTSSSSETARFSPTFGRRSSPAGDRSTALPEPDLARAASIRFFVIVSWWLLRRLKVERARFALVFSACIAKMNGIGSGGFSSLEMEYIRRHHRQEPGENQCGSALVKHIRAPVHLVWSLVRRFDQPQKYKPFVSRCVFKGNLEIGSLREVDVKSGLPATTSTERLELLDDDEHILRFRIIGGDHRLRNYSSIMSLHPEIIDGRPGTLVIESFMVDVPEGNTKDETCYFVEALIKCNLKSLADVSERLAVQDCTEPIDRMYELMIRSG